MQKIAIIGTACLFPEAETPQAYWKNLLSKQDSRSRATAQQMGRTADDYFAKNKGTKDKYYCTLGGYIHNYQFNANGYQLPAPQLENLDHTFQWSLQTAKEALKEAGYAGNAGNCGVILANLSFPTKQSNHVFLPLYQQLMQPALTELLGQDFKMPLTEKTDNLTNGGIAGMPASVVAQALGLNGIYLGLDAACASSLYSIKLACSYLLSGKADLMLAGAVSAGDPWFVSIGFSIFNAFPQNIASLPLDKNSKGLNTGEGAGFVVLKRFDEAEKDGDTILAVIDAIGLSNDGRGKFVLSPNEKGQVTCFERAYQAAGIEPKDIDYIECHATGTPLGDQTEIQSMSQYFSDKGSNFYIGSAKSNFGHLLTAAGMAGMNKMILALKNEAIPATIGLQNPMVSKDGKIGGTKVVSETRPWKKTTKTRKGGISAFGFGGTNAHLVFEEYRKDNKTEPTKIIAQTPLSIIGMGAYFGDCKNLAEFEQAIYQGQQSTQQIPLDRWLGFEQQPETLQQMGTKQAPQGHYIDQFDFDYLYFKIPPEQKAPLIPQQLLMMKVLDEALKDAKLPTGGNIGVIVAMEMDLTIHQFRGRVDSEWAINEGLEQAGINLNPAQKNKLINLVKDSFHNAVEINQFTSFIGNIIPCRICSLWDFSGPAFTISAEENSAFKALEVAKLFLEAGEVDAMVVGAVDLSGSFESVYLQNQRNKLNLQDKASLAFAEENQGWNIGEGAGAIVLKRTDQITPDEKPYAQISALAISSHQQNLAEITKQALISAKVTAQQIGYIELNSSGQSQQDAEELAALTEMTGQNTALGSVKINIGHTFAASGLASLIKTALCIQSNFIPALANWQKPKQNTLNWQEKGFYFPIDSRPWLNTTIDSKRYALVNSLSYDQSSGVCVLSQSNQKSRPNQALANPEVYLFLFAGNTVSELEQQLNAILDIAEKANFNQLALQHLKTFEAAQNPAYRLSLLAKGASDLVRESQSALKNIKIAIKSNKEWSTPFGSYLTPNPQAEKGKIAFVYPGGFNSYQGMLKQLFYLFPELQEELKECCSSLYKMMRSHYLYPQTINAPTKQDLKQVEADMGEDAVAMFESGITACVALTKVIQDILGIKAQAAFGHSMGELSMLFSTGTWASTDEMSATLHETATFKTRLVGEMDVVRKAWDLPPPCEGEAPIWGTYTLRTDAKTAQAVIDKEPRVFLIMINAPKEIVIAGDDAACRRVVKTLKWKLFPVPIKDVVHNELVKAEFEPLKKLHTMPVTLGSEMDFYTAANYQKTSLEADVIGHNIATFYCQQVDFPRLINQVYDDGARIFIELGPQSSCTKWVSETLNAENKPHLAVGTSRKGASDMLSLMRMVAKLSSHGVKINLERLFPKVIETVKKPSLVRPVILGKTSFSKAVLSEENKRLFGRGKTVQRGAFPAEVLMGMFGYQDGF